MFIYSQKIIQFVHEIKQTVKCILSKEIGLKVGRDRFLDRKQKSSYPIHIVIFNNKNMLGYFNPDFYELGFHECLMHSSKKQLHNVIRHEIAHYMTFIQYNGSIQPHGSEFKAFCKQMGWSEDVYKATTCLEDGLNISTPEESTILRKVQKLMALSTSSNKNEAEQAMIKSQQLLLKHNIESKYIEQEEEKIFLKRIMKQKKENAKMRTIATILETFFVTTVYNRAAGFIYLEILGNAVNIEIAEYVAHFLDSELDLLWNQAQQTTHLKGLTAKNSFFLGLAKGYCNKIQALKKEYQSEITQALMIIEKKLIDAKALIYPSLSKMQSKGNYCFKSLALGEKVGKQLTINPAINNAKNSKALIT